MKKAVPAAHKPTHRHAAEFWFFNRRRMDVPGMACDFCLQGAGFR